MKVHELVDDELWAYIEPLIPPHPPQPKGGHPWNPGRPALCGIRYVLRTGLQWQMLPLELGCGSGSTCWRRRQAWQAAGVWHRLHRVLLDKLGEADAIDWSRASADSASVPAKKGARRPGRARRTAARPRGHPGTKRHVVVDRQGIPLAIGLTAANRPDDGLLAALVDAIEPVKRPRGRPRRRPAKLHADKGYDYPHCRAALRRRGITPRIARKGVESTTRLGRHRWVAERTLAWLARYRRLAIRHERRADIHQAWLDLGCALICFNFLRQRRL